MANLLVANQTSTSQPESPFPLLLPYCVLPVTKPYTSQLAKEKPVQGPVSTLQSKARRVDLELRDDKLVTGTSYNLEIRLNFNTVVL